MGEKDDTILEVFASARTSADLVRDLAMVCFFCEKKEIKNQDPSEDVRSSCWLSKVRPCLLILF